MNIKLFDNNEVIGEVEMIDFHISDDDLDERLRVRRIIEKAFSEIYKHKIEVVV